MSDGRKLIVYELNEVPFRVLDLFIQRNPTSSLARILPRSDVFETFAEDGGDLSPWIMVMTSMGQHAVPDAEQVITQLYCIDLAKLMSGLGVPTGGWQRRRAMAPEYVAGISPEHHESLIEKLRTLAVNGQAIKFVDHGESVVFTFGHVNLDKVLVTLGGEPVPLEQLGLRNVEIQD